MAETTCRRTGALLTKKGIGASNDAEDEDPLMRDTPWLAGLYAHGVRGRIATGPNAGKRVTTWGGSGEAQEPEPSARRCANVDGFSVHANVSLPVHRRQKLENLCRYMLRPPLAVERLERVSAGRLAYRMKTSWRDGTTHVVMSDGELVECRRGPRRWLPLAATHTLHSPNSDREPVAFPHLYLRAGLVSAPVGDRRFQIDGAPERFLTPNATNGILTGYAPASAGSPEEKPLWIPTLATLNPPCARPFASNLQALGTLGTPTASIVSNTLSNDGLPGKQFDYMLSNPPFSVEWKKIEKEIRRCRNPWFSSIHFEVRQSQWMIAPEYAACHYWAWTKQDGQR